MTGIDLATAEFLTDLLPKIEDLGEAITDEGGIHVTRVEVARGERVIGHIVYEDETWAFVPSGDQDDEGPEAEDAAEEVEEEEEEEVEEEE